MYTATKVTIIALALLTAGVVTAQAQNNASINVSAAVQQPIVVLAGPNLTFGPVFPGVPKPSRLVVPAPAASTSPVKPALQ